MKKIVTLVLILALIAGTVFAQGQQESAASNEPIVLRLADNQPEGYPTVIGDLEFARLVQERSNGRIRIEVYHGGQLGDEKSAIEQVQFGGIDFTRVSISPLSNFNPALNALQMPYLYRNSDHMWKVLNGEIGEHFLNSLTESGFVGLSWQDSGARNFYNSVKPIYTVDDLKGMKIRVQESTLMMGMVSALGAVPTPMPYGDVYSALQTKVIEGAENNWPSYDTSSHFEVAKYYSIDEHTRVPEIIIASKISMDKLSKADQDLIKQAAKDSTPVQVAAWAAKEKVSEDKVRAAGVQINYVNDPAEFSARMGSLYEKLLDAEGLEWVKKVQAVK
ncbi:MAG: TRAP transporter substrate-binding protein [Sphaerochaetaceae bacterium]|nr:TRAP transporter substrate-binding protein [Sphaerochaetaceae bacterium]